MTSELLCALCGRNARYNHPYRMPDGRIICEHCGDHEVKGVRVQAIDQHTLEPINIWTEDGITVWHGFRGDTVAWTNGGGTAFALTGEDKQLSVDGIFALIKRVTANGFRCSHCKRDFGSDIPHEHVLFAGIRCPDCYAEHLKEVERERAEGHVCMMCGKPYSECYC